MPHTTDARWDTLAFYGSNYAQKDSVQLPAIKATSDQPSSDFR
jgi:hypothetical protein